MHPFPPTIVHALLSAPRHLEPNDEVRTIRERYERSRIRPRRGQRSRAGESGRVTVATVRLSDESAGAA